MNKLLEITKLAIELEEKGCQFYMQSAAKSKNPLAQETLKGLAQRETEHANKIKEYYQGLNNQLKIDTNWLKTVETPPDKKALLKPILDNLKDKLSKTFETEKDINEAYRIAQGLEKDSYKLYSDIVENTQDELTKKFFSALAKEEQEHYDILEETLQYLNNPGDWFKDKERWIVEG